MKFLIALAFCMCAVANAHHTPEHSLKGPLFIVGKTHRYEGTINMTSGIPGLSTQVAKSVLRFDLLINPVSQTEYLLKMEQVKVSEGVYAADSDDTPVTLRRNSQLEEELKKPTKFTLIDGQVTRYTLDPKDSVQAQKIKKSVLRNLEFTIRDRPEEQITNKPALEDRVPFAYNVTKDTTMGPVQSFYVVTWSPYADFPYDKNVYNISRTDDYETLPYLAVHKHHNFARQGCPDVCNDQEDSQNRNGAGCPMGHEPHHSPIKMSVTQHCHLFAHEGKMIPEIMEAEEKHIASMYDQDMVIRITAEYRLKNVISSQIEEPRDQTSYTQLHDLNQESSEQEIEDFEKKISYLADTKCGVQRPEEAIPVIERLLEEISEIVVRGDLERRESHQVGEKVILLQKALTLLKVNKLEEVAKKVVQVQALRSASEKDKVKRQIWIDMIPLIGSQEAVEYIKNAIKNNEFSDWEAKEILEALPANIMYPSEKNINDLRELLQLTQVKNVHLLHSAAHLTLATVIQRACVARNMSESRPNLKHTPTQHQQDMEELQQMPFAARLRFSSNYNEALEGLQQSSQESQWQKTNQCPTRLVQQIVRELSEKLTRTSRKQKMVVYIEALSRMGTPEVLPILTPYAYGIADDIQEWKPADIDFLKTVTVYSLHNLVVYYPQEILQLVAPIYFNKTEVPQVRTAAFSVILRANPSLAMLQHVAQDSWQEPSREVASYVYSALESFGNSSLPCLQLTANRIKKVISQTKRVDIGNNHAKNILMSYFDDVRAFGIEKRFAYTPSNESVIPASWYSSVMYSTDSFRDVLIQFAVNSQGITQEHLLKLIDLDILGIQIPKDIPRSKVENILSGAEFISRMPKDLRVTIFRKMFYSTSYYYFDASTISNDLKPLADHLQNILTMSRNEVNGHLVKLIIPSSYRTLTVGKTLTYPVEHEMKHPTIFAIKIQSKGTPTLEKFHFHVKPSVYHTTRYTLQFKNLGDCKSYGVVYEQKLAAVYPIEVKVQINKLDDIQITYKMPELPKRVISYSTEAATYAGQEKLERLPTEEDREPIRSIPTMFKKEKLVSVLGMPPVRAEFHSEDYQEGIFDVPRNWKEAVHIAATTLRNTGWTRRSLNVSMLALPRVWPAQTEVTVYVKYNTEHRFPNADQSQQQSYHHQHQQQQHQQQQPQQQQTPSPQEQDIEIESDRQLKTCWNCEDSKQEKTVQDIQVLLEKMTKQMTYIAHELDIKMESRPVAHKAHFRVEYNHTYDRTYHSLIINATAQEPQRNEPIEFNMVHIMKFEKTPNEFEYNVRKYGKQQAYFYNAINFNNKDVLEKPDIVSSVKFSYKPVEKMMEEELVESPEKEFFYPETHEECLNDIKEGKPESVACLRAVREQAIYNHLKMTVKWEQERIPDTIKNITDKIDQALKYWYYSQVQTNRVNVNNAPNTFRMSMDFIDKLTDEPLVNVYMWTPNENIKYNKVSPYWILPLSSVENVVETYVHKASNNTLWPTCSMMEKYVRTYDHKTYKLPENQCTYILSTQCTPRKKFAVLAKPVSQSTGAKEIRMYVGEHVIELTPAQRNVYNVKFNDKVYTVTPGRPIYFDREEEIHAYVRVVAEGSDNILTIHADNAGIKLQYNGKNVKLQVHPRYKGELCGLCSEYDGEETREFRGVNQCLYEDSQDFAMSAIVDAESCGVDKHPKKQWYCPEGGNVNEAPARSHHGRPSASSSEEDESENEPEFRNILVSRNEFTCFSTRPVAACKNDARPQQTESQDVEFHCLPKSDVTARKLAQEAKRRVLAELANKSVDFSETIEVAKSC